MAASQCVRGALHHIIWRGLGCRSVRAGGNPQVADLSRRDVVDETWWRREVNRQQKDGRLTVDVNRFEGCAVVITTIRGGRSVGLSRVGLPVLRHLGAVDDVHHRTLDVLFDQSTEGGVIGHERGGGGGGGVLVGFAEGDNLLAEYTLRTSEIVISNGSAKKKKTACFTHRLEFAKV